MEYYWTLFNNTPNNIGTTPNRSAPPPPYGSSTSNSNNNSAWDSWELSGGAPPQAEWSYPFAADGEKDQIHQTPLCYNMPDPHLTCLKLGKRQYFEHVTTVAPPPPTAAASKKGRPHLATEVVQRCQVEGCEVVLVDAKEYHRRHKVCEMHAKAVKVVVLGMEQRFCQQCSRFHAVAEFDETKRSCRRRLAGHNERRRKGSQEHHSLARKAPYLDVKMMIGSGTNPHLLSSSECALSLLSSPNYTFPYNIPHAPPQCSTSDLPAKCSAALRELIAENRASILACRQFVNPDNNYRSDDSNMTRKVRSDPQENGGHVTLDLMQAPNSEFGLFSVHDPKTPLSKAGNEQDCSELWKVPLGNY